MNFKLLLFLVALLLVAYVLYCVYLFWNASQKSVPLVAEAVPFNRESVEYQKSILVVGDSLAVGVGAPSNESIASKLADALDANVTNFGKSGAQTRDLSGQIARAQKDKYDLVLIHMGANDIIQFQSLSTAEHNMENALTEIKAKSDHVVFLFAGNIGEAPIWPWPFSVIYSARSVELTKRYQALAIKHDALFIDILSKGDIFSSDAKRYYASDNLHLSAAGYDRWFAFITESIRGKWPGLLH